MAQRIIHGRHFAKPHYTKCGLEVRNRSWNHNTQGIVNTNAMSSITCRECIKANKPGKV